MLMALVGLAGLLFGLAISTLLYAGTAAALGLATIGNIGGLLAPFLSPVLATVTAASWLSVAVFTLGVFYVWGYVVATLGVLGPLAPLAAPAPGIVTPVRLAVTLPEYFGRCFLIGLGAGTNFAAWALTPVAGGVIVGTVLLITGALTAVPALSRSRIYQGLMGWTSWLRPASWLATAFGLILFVLNLPTALAAFGLAALRFDFLTATVETAGGTLTAIGATPGSRRGFNLGNFTFVTPGPAATGSFTSPTLSTHETGHTLNAAAFGGLVNWVNALDENPPGVRRSFAYGELTAEGHFPRSGSGFGPGGGLVPRAFVGFWS
ncbi:hypothetical protein [Georgenia yuyongxinii]|uniref:Uncharacterized protein n=1 Tax=Georgenia yuyongxinii TaxID=2589797 RepID=A0A552WXU2_9MICO|nr:hypothetical protein [Georgenia yuyongxinii]TRW47650.1 hypothetical protein FJ693_00680 [Georgenia yuyongxinii]